MLKCLSTGALDGMTVLYLMKRSLILRCIVHISCWIIEVCQMVLHSLSLCVWSDKEVGSSILEWKEVGSSMLSQ